jgi:hypothetical protein
MGLGKDTSNICVLKGLLFHPSFITFVAIDQYTRSSSARFTVDEERSSGLDFIALSVVIDKFKEIDDSLYFARCPVLPVGQAPMGKIMHIIRVLKREFQISPFKCPIVAEVGGEIHFFTFNCEVSKRISENPPFFKREIGENFCFFPEFCQTNDQRNGLLIKHSHERKMIRWFRSRYGDVFSR